MARQRKAEWLKPDDLILFVIYNDLNDSRKIEITWFLDKLFYDWEKLNFDVDTMHWVVINFVK